MVRDCIATSSSDVARVDPRLVQLQEALRSTAQRLATEFCTRSMELFEALDAADESERRETEAASHIANADECNEALDECLFAKRKFRMVAGRPPRRMRSPPSSVVSWWSKLVAHLR